MIQRIQTLFLLVALVLLSTLLFMPTAEMIVNNSSVYLLKFNGFVHVGDNVDGIIALWPYTILVCFNALGLFLAIFLYRKRVWQMRLSMLVALLLLGQVGLSYFYIHSFVADYQAIVAYKMAAIFPLVCAVLAYLAFRQIRKDELLVRSINRIR